LASWSPRIIHQTVCIGAVSLILSIPCNPSGTSKEPPRKTRDRHRISRQCTRWQPRTCRKRNTVTLLKIPSNGRFGPIWGAGFIPRGASAPPRRLFILASAASARHGSNCPRFSGEEFPAFAEGRFEVLIGLAVVGEFHGAGIPVEAALELHRDHAQQHPLDEWPGHAEVRAGRVASL